MLTCNYLFTSSLVMSESTIVLNPTLPEHFNLTVIVGFMLLHVALISSNTMLNNVPQLCKMAKVKMVNIKRYCTFINFKVVKKLSSQSWQNSCVKSVKTN